MRDDHRLAASSVDQRIDVGRQQRVSLVQIQCVAEPEDDARDDLVAAHRDRRRKSCGMTVTNPQMSRPRDAISGLQYLLLIG